MSSISIKGILAGVVVEFLVGMVLGFVALSMIVGPEHDYDLDKAIEAIGPAMFESVVLAARFVISVGAGYAAAYVAGRGELINGALSMGLSVVIALIGAIALESVDYPAQNIISIAITPLAGLLGGYLRLRQVRARSADASAQA